LWLPIALPAAMAAVRGPRRLVAGNDQARPPGAPRGSGAWFMVGVAGALAAFAALSLALPNLLHPADLPRVTEQFGWPGGVPAFVRRARPAQIVELAVPWIALAAAAVAWWRERRAGWWRERRIALWTLGLPALACVVPAWRADALDLGYRLALLSPLFGVPLLAAARVRGPQAPGHADSPPFAAALRAAAAVAAVLGLLFAAPAGFDASADPPYARYRRVAEAVPRPLPPLLIAHQGMSFLYTHLTGADAMAWAPEPELDRKQVGRVAWGIRPGEWMAWAWEPAPVPLDPEYAYVREDVWEVFVARAKVEGDDDLRERLRDWRNPSKVRPA